MNVLKDLQMCNIKSNNKFSIVTIEKWQEYQIEELKNNNNLSNNATTTQHKQECKEYYINLFNKYKEQNRKRFKSKNEIFKRAKRKRKYFRKRRRRIKRINSRG